MDNGRYIKKGIGFAEALQLVFIVLKLCNVIDWSWWIVLLPTLIYAAMILLFILGFIVYEIVKKWKQRGTVACRDCEYGGCISTTLYGSYIHCRKTNSNKPTDYRCKDGELFKD